ncbi:MAG: beta-lactamase family protein [Rickettsiales bacterium]|nr:beta-lactamase family protein [Rickettsiales bacterium]
MSLDDLSIIAGNGLSAKSESELAENFRTFSSKREELSGRVIDSDIAVLGNGKSFHKRNSEDEKIFQIASITKTFTAAALVRIMVDNPDYFDRDDPLATKISVFKDRLKPEAKAYFEKLEFDPEFHYEDITLRHVLNHSSGVICQDFSDKFRSDQTKELRLSEDTVPVKSEVGFGEFSYSDANYNYIIEPIIEAVTGRNFADVIRDEIIIPCELHQTFMFDEMKYDRERNEVFVEGRPEIKVAQGYDYFDGKYTSTQDFNYDSAAGGIYSSAHDVAKFYQKLLSGEMIGDEEDQQKFDDIFFKDENFIDSDKFKYGAGIRRIENEGKEYFLHSGSAYGFNSCVWGQRNLDAEKEVKICAAVISYENLTREIAADSIGDKKIKPSGEFFVDDELKDKMDELARSNSLEQLIEIRKEMEENHKMGKEDSWAARIRQEEQKKSKENVR